MRTVAADVVESPVALVRRVETPNTSRAVRAGELVRVARGVYAATEDWRALAPWERYLARVHAVAPSYPDAVMTLEAGAALRGLPTFGEPNEVHLLLPSPAKSRAVRGVRIHTAERMPRSELLGGIRVADSAELAVDIARARHPAIGLAVAGAVLRRDEALSASELAAVSAERPSSRGARSARWVFERVTPVPESPLENVSLAVAEWLGFPAPRLQEWILGPGGDDDDRLDFWWESWRIAGEADGDIKYSGAFGDARQALRQRNARDARLRDRGVRATAHWAFSDVVAWRQLRAILIGAGLPLVRPEQTAPLLSLPHALRGRSAPRPGARPR